MTTTGEAVHELTKCRICDSTHLRPVLTLGEQSVSDFIGGDETSPHVGLRVPLDLVICDVSKGGCGLLQLRHTVNRRLLYKKYWYKSGMNDTMKAALEEIAWKAERTAPLSDDDMVIDIGCNDGTLLRGYTKHLIRVGFEPTTNLLSEARSGTSLIINDFFNYDAFARHFPKKRAKCITSIAMFYSIEDPNQFVSDVAKCLDVNGLWIIQMAYLGAMLDTNNFDNICHEHLEYYSLLSLEKLMERHSLSVIDVELNEIYGGSFRIYVRPNTSAIKKSSAVIAMEEAEIRLGLDRPDVYRAFAKKIRELKRQVGTFIQNEVNRGKTVYVYGASTKGNVILQYFGLDNHLIKAAAERNPDKWGRTTVGTMIPIVSEEQARAEKPDYFLVLPWAFLKEFKRREKAFLERGGKFIVPLPELKIIGNSD